jgi:hypothetical protein
MSTAKIIRVLNYEESTNKDEKHEKNDSLHVEIEESATEIGGDHRKMITMRMSRTPGA